MRNILPFRALLLLLILASCAARPSTTLVRNKTDNQLDIAIDGDGYFMVQTTAKGVLFTRSGALSVDASGLLVNADGYKLFPLVAIPAETNNILIARDGVVRTEHAGQPPEVAGQIVLSRFARPGKLDHDGIYCLPTDGSGDPITAPPGRKGLGTLITGTLEVP